VVTVTRPVQVPLASFDLASWLALAPPPAQDKMFSAEMAVVPRPGRVPPRRGWPGPFGGRAPLVPSVPVHRGSTAEVQGLYPWLYGAGLPPAGAYLGLDCLTGGAFCCHPLEWLRLGLVSNPNIVVTGIPGAGKSATIKALGMRLMAYGVRMFVCGDLKNEYAAMARVLGTEPVELGPGACPPGSTAFGGQRPGWLPSGGELDRAGDVVALDCGGEPVDLDAAGAGCCAVVDAVRDVAGCPCLGRPLCCFFCHADAAGEDSYSQSVISFRDTFIAIQKPSVVTAGPAWR
jgi:hypothetical protein